MVNWIGFIFFVIGVGIASIILTLVSMRIAWLAFRREPGQKKLVKKVVAIATLLVGLGGTAWAITMWVVLGVSF